LVDKAIQQISSFAAQLRYIDLPEEVRVMAQTAVVDTLGCAAGGYNCDAAVIARRLLSNVDPDDAFVGRVFGSAHLASVEQAAFANTCMIRFLDFNDFYPSSHPSDMIGGLLAMSGHPGVSGERFLTAVAVAYEVSARVSDATQMRQNGWDQGYAIGLGTVAGLGNMLGATADVIARALSLVATANVHLRNTRAGVLSMWKGAATAFAVRNGVFALLLAREGMTAPESPIEGRHGLQEQITGPFELRPFPEGADGEYRILRTTVKFWPVEYNATAGILGAQMLREQVRLEDLAEVTIGTYWTSWHEIGSEPAKWDPRSRETADHSMPYIFAAVMRDGGLTLKTFEPESFLDPDLREQMAKIKVHVDEECDREFPDHILLKVRARGTDGRLYSVDARDPRGFWTNPMSLAEVRQKFRELATPLFGQQRAEEFLEFWSDLAARDDLAAGFPLAMVPLPQTASSGGNAHG
jgi:2-methylcitrate dehydratase